MSLLYRALFHAALRHIDAEAAHRLSFGTLRGLAAVPGAAGLLGRVLGPREPELAVTVFGRELGGPLGLAAGFDKNAEGVDALAGLGFAHVEIGTVTARPQPGNPRPRLFRLVADRAIVNRMGFNNEGAVAVAGRLARRRARGTPLEPVVGANIGRTKVVPESEALGDYVTSARRLAGRADYLVVNVSSPNTPGLRDMQAVERLRPLLGAVRDTLDRTDVPDIPDGPDAGAPRTPLLVKIAPDLTDDAVDAVADLALELGLDGIIATNTTVTRAGLASHPRRVEAAGAGGLSGAPLRDRALAVLRRLRARVGDRVVLVAVGGIETPLDAWERIRAGATLVQGYTGLIYHGPLWPRRMHKGLARLVRAAGYPSIADAVGTAAPAEDGGHPPVSAPRGGRDRARRPAGGRRGGRGGFARR